ncbi:uncharacterized protein [Solanum lycopersicum]|uniref:uncharacterized protein n=1 Tax=Solanum lycopersicum TaxID=4081 RepID=UPI003747F0B3
MYSGRANSLCFRRTPLLEEVALGMPFNMLESFTVPEPQLTLDNIKILNFKNLIFAKVDWVTYVLDLISRFPNIERLLITSDALETCECMYTSLAIKRNDTKCNEAAQKRGYDPPLLG